MKEPYFFENSKVPVFLSKFAPIEIFAITLGPFIFCRGKLSKEVKLHETIHFYQYRETWYIGFLFYYLVDFIYAAAVKKKGFSRDAYLSIRFEQEAWDCDSKEDYLETREKNAWKKYPLGGK